MLSPLKDEQTHTDIIDGEAWLLDKQKRADPAELTLLFHRSVPVLKHLDWAVLETGFGSATTVLPLNVQSSNQHIAHQAAVILIAADYTGGIASGTCLTGVPLVGIHPQHDDNAAYLWGAKAEIKWIRPSTDDLVCRASLDEKQIRRIRDRYFSGKRVLETVEIEMFNGAERVAEAAVTYWIQDTVALRRNAIDPSGIHVLYDHKTKVSAKLIAGMRALEQQRPKVERLFDDQTAETAAGKHGTTIARRFSEFAPQLQRMVAARTHVLDRVVASLPAGNPWQIVNIGSGLDTRFGRIGLPASYRIFNLDLPHMLELRKKTLGQAEAPNSYALPFDIHDTPLTAVLSSSSEFSAARPTLFIWEGGSMYFEKRKTKKLLTDCHAIMNDDSILWMDFVDRAVVDGTHSNPAVARFISEMRAFGEPFVSGFDDIAGFLNDCGFRANELVKSSLFADRPSDVFESYAFVTAARKT